eukprot:TRINITY_DN1073_c0_g1_i1.p1 TRINITY_DN1073_c0_g1~~TRINITY_DN1073_c0_g1_i1.p1  ORF type:complete len:1439 (-),score=202.22 TRINITY_DN1073_c0_g1_i1:92-4408(-)
MQGPFGGGQEKGHGRRGIRFNMDGYQFSLVLCVWVSRWLDGSAIHTPSVGASVDSPVRFGGSTVSGPKVATGGVFNGSVEANATGAGEGGAAKSSTINVDSTDGVPAASTASGNTETAVSKTGFGPSVEEQIGNEALAATPPRRTLMRSKTTHMNSQAPIDHVLGLLEGARDAVREAQVHAAGAPRGGMGVTAASLGNVAASTSTTASAVASAPNASRNIDKAAPPMATAALDASAGVLTNEKPRAHAHAATSHKSILRFTSASPGIGDANVSLSTGPPSGALQPRASGTGDVVAATKTEATFDASDAIETNGNSKAAPGVKLGNPLDVASAALEAAARWRPTSADGPAAGVADGTATSAASSVATKAAAAAAAAAAGGANVAQSAAVRSVDAATAAKAAVMKAHRKTTQSINDASSRAASGAKQVVDAAKAIRDGAQPLAAVMKAHRKTTQSINDASSRAASGAKQVVDAAKAIRDGAPPLGQTASLSLPLNQQEHWTKWLQRRKADVGLDASSMVSTETTEGHERANPYQLRRDEAMRSLLLRHVRGHRKGGLGDVRLLHSGRPKQDGFRERRLRPRGSSFRQRRTLRRDLGPPPFQRRGVEAPIVAAAGESSSADHTHRRTQYGNATGFGGLAYRPGYARVRPAGYRGRSSRGGSGNVLNHGDRSGTLLAGAVPRQPAGVAPVNGTGSLLHRKFATSARRTTKGFPGEQAKAASMQGQYPMFPPEAMAASMQGQYPMFPPEAMAASMQWPYPMLPPEAVPMQKSTPPPKAGALQPNRVDGKLPRLRPLGSQARTANASSEAEVAWRRRFGFYTAALERQKTALWANPSLYGPNGVHVGIAQLQNLGLQNAYLHKKIDKLDKLSGEILRALDEVVPHACNGAQSRSKLPKNKAHKRSLAERLKQSRKDAERAKKKKCKAVRKKAHRCCGPKKAHRCPKCKKTKPRPPKAHRCPKCKKTKPRPPKAHRCPKCKKTKPRPPKAPPCPKCKKAKPPPPQACSQPCPAALQQPPPPLVWPFAGSPPVQTPCVAGRSFQAPCSQPPCMNAVAPPLAALGPGPALGPTNVTPYIPDVSQRQAFPGPPVPPRATQPSSSKVAPLTMIVAPFAMVSPPHGAEATATNAAATPIQPCTPAAIATLCNTTMTTTACKATPCPTQAKPVLTTTTTTTTTTRPCTTTPCTTTPCITTPCTKAPCTTTPCTTTPCTTKPCTTKLCTTKPCTTMPRKTKSRSCHSACGTKQQKADVKRSRSLETRTPCKKRSAREKRSPCKKLVVKKKLTPCRKRLPRRTWKPCKKRSPCSKRSPNGTKKTQKKTLLAKEKRWLGRRAARGNTKRLPRNTKAARTRRKRLSNTTSAHHAKRRRPSWRLRLIPPLPKVVLPPPVRLARVVIPISPADHMDEKPYAKVERAAFSGMVDSSDVMEKLLFGTRTPSLGDLSDTR